MKKIKFLHGFIIVLIVIYICHFVGNFYLTFFTDFTKQFESLNAGFIFGYYTQFVVLLFSVITFIGLLFIKRGLRIIIKVELFNLRSATQFKTGGMFFLVSGALSFLFDFLIIYRSESPNLLGNLGQDFLLMVIGFGLYIVADILQNGNVIKQENELTI